MSRQAERAKQRAIDKKIGQLVSLKFENAHIRNRKGAQANLKNMIRLEGELMDLGVLKRPTKWQTFWGRLRITLIGLKRKWL